VRAGEFQPDMRVLFGQRVNQQPVRLDMAIATAGKVSTQWMIQICRRQFFAGNEQIKDGF
jgi:hypothetical protein